jgi:hypothetical protein
MLLVTGTRSVGYGRVNTLGRLPSLRGAHKSPAMCYEILERERLHDEIRGPHILPAQAIDLLVARGNDQNRDSGGRRSLSQLAAHFETVRVRQIQVEEDEICGSTRRRDPFPRGCGASDRKAGIREGVADEVLNIGIILDEDDSSAGFASARLRRKRRGGRRRRERFGRHRPARYSAATATM